MIPKGTIIEGPDGQAFELARDLHAHRAPSSQDFIARGGAPEPLEGALMPNWLFSHLRDHFMREAADRG